MIEFSHRDYQISYEALPLVQRFTAASQLGHCGPSWAWWYGLSTATAIWMRRQHTPLVRWCPAPARASLFAVQSLARWRHGAVGFVCRSAPVTDGKGRTLWGCV
jgi:hypothetical protein